MIKYRGENISIAKTLRKNATPQERKLWYEFLSAYSVRFQRQKAIGNYVVDFYCHKAKLVLEIDGTQHFLEEGKEKDCKRDEFLHSLGLTILRFANNQINENFIAVCEMIDKTVKEKINDNN